VRESEISIQADTISMATNNFIARLLKE